MPPLETRKSGLTHFWKTVVHTSAYLLNRHESIWGSDKNDFNPSRWLQRDAMKLDKYMASFYKGTRQCLGLQSVSVSDATRKVS